MKYHLIKGHRTSVSNNRWRLPGPTNKHSPHILSGRTLPSSHFNCTLSKIKPRSTLQIPVRTGPAPPFQHLDVEELNGGPVTDLEVGSINQWSQHEPLRHKSIVVSLGVCDITPLPPLIGMQGFQLRGTCALELVKNGSVYRSVPRNTSKDRRCVATACGIRKLEGENSEGSLLEILALFFNLNVDMILKLASSESIREAASLVSPW